MNIQPHCPYRQSQNLLDALASDKTKVAFLLGAGCPVSMPDPGGDGTKPLIPAIYGLTQDVRKILEASESQKECFNAVIKRFDGMEKTATIEDVLSHIRTLQEVVRDGDIHGLTKDSLEKLDAEICRITTSIVDVSLPNGITPYHQLATWIGDIRRDHPIEVFTPNYDLLMEQALESNNIPYFDGFVGSREAFFDLTSMEENEFSSASLNLPVRWSRLWKLHGSINWWGRLEKEGKDHNNFRVLRTQSEKTSEGDRQMIYPSHLKYDQSRRLPYLAMLDRLKNFLSRGQTVLVTCGYSFADQHLNEIIYQGLRSNRTAICFGLLYGDRKNYADVVDKAKKYHPNLSLLAGDGAVLGTIDRDWSNERKPNHVMHGLSVEAPESKNGDIATPDNCKFVLGDFKHFGNFLAQQLSRFDDDEQKQMKVGDAT